MSGLSVFTPFITSVVREFDAYVPGRSVAEIKEAYGLDRVIKLASNENPLGTSPLVQKVIREQAAQAFRYPQAGNPRLVKAIGELHKISPRRVVTTNGSDEIIDLLFRVCAEPGVHNAVAFSPCFGLYTTQSRFAGVELRQAPLRPNFSFDFETLLRLVDEKTTLVIITSPDNPSGYAVKKEVLADFAGQLPPHCLLVVDEAYVDFAREEDGGEKAFSVFSELDAHPNIAVLRTFSKSRGLAGLRLGYAVLPEELAEYVWRVRLPFSVNLLAEEAGLAALADTDFRGRTLKVVAEGRRQLEEGMRAQGWDVVPSQANFIMVSHPRVSDAAKVNEGLLHRGFIVRPLGSYGLPGRLRISVGTEEENTLLLEAIGDVMANLLN